MAGQIEPIARMAQQLSRLPGIGAKTAQRLAYHIVSLPEDQVHELASAIWQGRKAVKYCSICGNYTVEDPCPICADEKRHNGVICVVRDPRDVAAMERMRDFKGCYHVLHGTIYKKATDLFGSIIEEEDKEREPPVADASAQVPAIATALRSVDGSIIHRRFQFVNPFLHVLIFVISL